MKLLARTLVFAAFLLAAYSWWLRVLPAPVAVPQSNDQYNIIKLQEYLYARQRNYSTVIVGSSLAAKLRPQVLPHDVYNLALHGQTVFEGLELVRRAGRVPRRVLIEINVLDRAYNRGTVEELFSPALYTARRWYPGLQARHQPLNEGLGCGLALLARLRPAAAAGIQEKLGVSQSLAPSTLPTDAPDYQPSNAEVVTLNRADYDHLPPAASFGRNLALLRYYVRYFTARGSQVVFFEMPLDAHICQSPKMQYIRQQLAAAYPAHQLRYLPPPDCAAYRTTDGLHLTDPSAWRYSLVLAQELKALPGREALVARAAARPPHQAPRP